MKPTDDRRVFRRVTLLTLIAMGVVLAGPASAQSTLYPTDYIYLTTEDCPLSFQDKATILEALRTGSRRAWVLPLRPSSLKPILRSHVL